MSLPHHITVYVLTENGSMIIREKLSPSLADCLFWASIYAARLPEGQSVKMVTLDSRLAYKAEV